MCIYEYLSTTLRLSYDMSETLMTVLNYDIPNKVASQTIGITIYLTVGMINK